jgi:hypothetical protein
MQGCMTANLPPGVSVVRRTAFRSHTFATASLEMRTNGKLWSVIRSLPPGMDITERDHWQFRSESDAFRAFDNLAIRLSEQGFKTV